MCGTFMIVLESMKTCRARARVEAVGLERPQRVVLVKPVTVMEGKQQVRHLLVVGMPKHLALSF
jgi:hypothetical protein